MPQSQQNALVETPSGVHAANKGAKTERTTAAADSARDEMNLAEFPLAVLSTRANPSIKTLEFADRQRLKTGEVIDRRWIITGADKFGLPTATDDDVVLGLMRLTMNQGFRERKVYFSRYELLKILRWSTEGRSYQRLTKSLDRLSGVRIRATNAFYDNTSKSHQTRNFGVIDAYEINDERGTKGPGVEGQRKSFFIWSEVLFDSFKSGFIKKLDLEIYFCLKSAVSRRLYRYLDKHFYYKNTIEKDLMPLAFEKIGISRNYKYVSSVKQQIEPAAEELVKIGFLRDFSFSGRGEQTRVRFTLNRGDSILESSERVEGHSESRQTDTKALYLKQKKRVHAELTSRGISREQAGRLLARKSDVELKKIVGIIRYYDHLVQTNDYKVSKNKIGFLYRAVQYPYKFAIPTNFDPNIEPGQVDRQRRPELRIVRASSRNGSSQEVAEQSSMSERSTEALSELSPEQVKIAYQKVESKLGFLKSVLDPTRYQKAVENCVREELLTMCEVEN